MLPLIFASILTVILLFRVYFELSRNIFDKYTCFFIVGETLWISLLACPTSFIKKYETYSLFGVSCPIIWAFASIIGIIYVFWYDYYVFEDKLKSLKNVPNENHEESSLVR